MLKNGGKSLCGSGGARRDRTDDLLLAKQALSQLSYGPVNSAACDSDLFRSQRDAATAAIYLRMAAGGQPLFSDRAAPVEAEKKGSQRDCMPAALRRYSAGLSSGRRVTHGVQNRVVSHLTTTDIQPIGQMRVLL